MEYGISGQKLKADGTSPRVDQKLRTKYNNDPHYKGEVIDPDLGNRVDALGWERQKATSFKEATGDAPPNQIRPKVD